MQANAQQDRVLVGKAQTIEVTSSNDSKGHKNTSDLKDKSAILDSLSVAQHAASRTIEIQQKSSMARIPSQPKDRATFINSTSKIRNDNEQNNLENADQQADVESSMLEQSQMAGTFKTRDDRIYNQSRSNDREGTVGSINGSDRKNNQNNPDNIDINNIKDLELVDFKKSSQLLLEQLQLNQDKVVTIHQGEAPLPRSRFNNTLMRGMKMNQMNKTQGRKFTQSFEPQLYDPKMLWADEFIIQNESSNFSNEQRDQVNMKMQEILRNIDCQSLFLKSHRQSIDSQKIQNSNTSQINGRESSQNKTSRMSKHAKNKFISNQERIALNKILLEQKVQKNSGDFKEELKKLTNQQLLQAQVELMPNFGLYFKSDLSSQNSQRIKMRSNIQTQNTSRQLSPKWKRDQQTHKFALLDGNKFNSPQLLKYPDLGYLFDESFHIQRQANALSFEPPIRESFNPRDPHYLLNQQVEQLNDQIFKYQIELPSSLSDKYVTVGQLPSRAIFSQPAVRSNPLQRNANTKINERQVTRPTHRYRAAINPISTQSVTPAANLEIHRESPLLGAKQIQDDQKALQQDVEKDVKEVQDKTQEIEDKIQKDKQTIIQKGQDNNVNEEKVVETQVNSLNGNSPKQTRIEGTNQTMQTSNVQAGVINSTEQTYRPETTGRYNLSGSKTQDHRRDSIETSEAMAENSSRSGVYTRYKGRSDVYTLSRGAEGDDTAVLAEQVKDSGQFLMNDKLIQQTLLKNSQVEIPSTKGLPSSQEQSKNSQQILVEKTKDQKESLGQIILIQGQKTAQLNDVGLQKDVIASSDSINKDSATQILVPREHKSIQSMLGSTHIQGGGDTVIEPQIQSTERLINPIQNIKLAQISSFDSCDPDSQVLDRHIVNQEFHPVTSIIKDKRKHRRTSQANIKDSKNIQLQKEQSKQARIKSILQSFSSGELEQLRENFNLEEIIEQYKVKDVKQLRSILNQMNDELSVKSEFFQKQPLQIINDNLSKDMKITEQNKPPKLHLNKLGKYKWQRMVTSSVSSYNQKYNLQNIDYLMSNDASIIGQKSPLAATDGFSSGISQTRTSRHQQAGLFNLPEIRIIASQGAPTPNNFQQSMLQSTNRPQDASLASSNLETKRAMLSKYQEANKSIQAALISQQQHALRRSSLLYEDHSTYQSTGLQRGLLQFQAKQIGPKMAESPRIYIDTNRQTISQMGPKPKNWVSCSVDNEVSMINTIQIENNMRQSQPTNYIQGQNNLMSKSIDFEAINRYQKPTLRQNNRKNDFKSYCKKLGTQIFAGEKKNVFGKTSNRNRKLYQSLQSSQPEDSLLMDSTGLNLHQAQTLFDTPQASIKKPSSRLSLNVKKNQAAQTTGPFNLSQATSSQGTQRSQIKDTATFKHFKCFVPGAGSIKHGNLRKIDSWAIENICTKCTDWNIGKVKKEIKSWTKEVPNKHDQKQ